MAPAPPANKVFAFVVPRGDVTTLPDVLARAPRALPINGRTLVVPHERDPHPLFERELEAIVGPATGRGPFARVPLHSVGTAAIGSQAYLSWVRTAPFTARQALPGEPWDARDRLTRALAAMPDAIDEGGLAGFWAHATRTKLTSHPDIDPDRLAAWADAAAEDLAATVRPVVVHVDAPTDDRSFATGRWAWWPPSFW